MPVAVGSYRNVPILKAGVAALVGLNRPADLLQTKRRAVSLDVAKAFTVIALLVLGSARLGAFGDLVLWVVLVRQESDGCP